METCSTIDPSLAWLRFATLIIQQRWQQQSGVGGSRAGGLRDGSPQAGSRGIVVVGVWAMIPQKLEHFYKIAL